MVQKDKCDIDNNETQHQTKNTRAELDKITSNNQKI